MAITRSSDVSFDKLDYKILAPLYREGRITKTRMSEEVGLSATRCWERMRRLEKHGVIRGYHADIDLRRLAKLSLYQVQVSLTNPSVANARLFERFVKNIDEIVSCHAVLGTVDYLLIIAAPGTEVFQAIMEDISTRESIRFDYITFPIAKTVKAAHEVPLLALIESANATTDF